MSDFHNICSESTPPDAVEAASRCFVCDGAGEPLGQLGERTWFRCRACGTRFARGEFLRFFSLRHRALLSCHTDGTVHIQRLDSAWQRCARKKDDIALEDWMRHRREVVQRLPAWAREVIRLPSLEELEEWVSDGVCDTPTGQRVELDGEGPDGVPNWLRCLGLI